jgi:hypothetical protein
MTQGQAAALKMISNASFMTMSDLNKTLACLRSSEYTSLTAFFYNSQVEVFERRGQSQAPQCRSAYGLTRSALLGGTTMASIV